MSDEDQELSCQYEIDPDMIMSMRISDDEIVVYLNENNKLTFTQYALDLLGEAIAPHLSE
jgi:hypothetical protein